MSTSPGRRADPPVGATPAFSVVRGAPDDDELAALVVVLTLLVTGTATSVRPVERERPGWTRARTRAAQSREAAAGSFGPPW